MPFRSAVLAAVTALAASLVVTAPAAAASSAIPAP